MEDLPSDVLAQVFSFLTNDGVAVGRLSLCSRDIYQRLTTQYDQQWHETVLRRWPTASSRLDYSDSYKGESRWEYIRRHQLDRRAKEILGIMTKELSESLEIDGGSDSVDGNSHVGQAWTHPTWKDLLSMRKDAVDVLRAEAQRKSDSTTRQKLRSFLAARSLQNLQFAQCLQEWKDTQQIIETNSVRMLTDSAFNAQILERYAILVNQIQQTPPELLETRDLKQSIIERLDDLAEECRKSFDEGMSQVEKVQAVNNCLVHEQKYRGNSDDYYNYKNSLLDCTLETKKGIPITLAILYTCVCRRLNLNVHLVGLPGHVVLGFPTEEGETRFLDVFREGDILTIEDCRQICMSYGFPWQAEFLRPLPAPHVLQRCLNNLSNCYFHALANTAEPFQADLFFNQRALASIHKQPPGIALPLIDRLAEEIPLTLSPHLLRFYGLMSESGNA